MGNNFTYNSSEFGRNDVYNTVRSYLSTGKINFKYSGCVIQYIMYVYLTLHWVATSLISTVAIISED